MGEQPAVSLAEVKRRIVEVVAAGTSDERGGCDMAKLAPLYKRAFGQSLDATLYGMPKLSMLVSAIEELVVDYCGPGTRSVIRLQGESVTPRQQKPKAPKKPKSEAKSEAKTEIKSAPKARKQREAAPAGAGSEDLVSMEEVRRRIVYLVQHGNEGRDGDSFGGVDMARIAPLWTKEYGSKLVPTQYGYAKLGPMVADMADILVVDHIHRTKKIVRLAGAPGVNGPGAGSQTNAKAAKPVAAAAAESRPQEDGWGQPAGLGGWDDPTSTAAVGDWGSSEAEPSLGWDDPPAPTPAPFGMGLPANAQGTAMSPSKKVFAVSPRFDSIQQAALGGPLQGSVGVATTAQLFGLPQPNVMNASVQSFFGQAAAGFGTHTLGAHVAPLHSAPAPAVPVQPASPPADQLLFGAPLLDGWGSSEPADPAGVLAPDARMGVPLVGPSVAAERAATKAANDEKRRAAQKAKREEAKLKKRAAAEARKAAEADARKQNKEIEQAGKRGKALCGKLRSAFAALDPRLMWAALADADRFEAQFAGVDLPAVAQEVEAIAKLRVDVKHAYTVQALEAIEAMTPLLGADADLGAVSSAVIQYAPFSDDITVEAIRGVLLNKVNAAKTELLEAAAAAEGRPEAFAELNAIIKKHTSHSRILYAEIRDAKEAKSALLSQCARELGGLVHKSAKKGNSVTAAQIEKKLAQFDGFPEEGSIGESLSKLRPLLAAKQKEEEAKAKAIAAQKAKENALKAKKERAEQQAKEEAEFWAAHEQATRAEEARQFQLWAESAARAEAIAAAKEAEMQEAERAAAARQAEEDAANNAAKTKELNEREKAERKAAKKARQAEEKAKAQEEQKQRQMADEAAAVIAAEALNRRISSVLKTSPHFSPLREGGDLPGGKGIAAKKVAWLDLDQEATEEQELRKAEKRREANRKKKLKKKQKEADKKAAGDPEDAITTGPASGATETVGREALGVGDEEVENGNEEEGDGGDGGVDFATDSYQQHYDAMEELD